MPNFKTKEITMPNFPVRFGDSDFEYLASSGKDEILVKVSQASEEFFLQIRKKGDKFLVKGDKISRPSQVVFLQQALRDFRDLCQCEATFSNIEPQKIKNKKRYRVLKDIDFFTNDFNSNKEIWMEVGFGSGRHLMHQAKLHPHIQFIGIEIHKPSLEQVAKLCDIESIDNIFLLDYDARIFLEFLKANSVGKIFVHFPVPWDKKPQRRVISNEFINESIRVLKKESKLELRTDSDNYFNYSLEEFLKLNRANLQVHKNQNLEISSKYEDRWKRQEKDIYDITMVNEEDSADTEPIRKISFDSYYDFNLIKEKFSNTIEQEGDSFLHVEDIFRINDDAGMLKISFGASSKNERAYVLFLDKTLQYFPDNILQTKANLKAHNLLNNWLKEIVS
ncbi:MAG: tRNA (guanosine(46)-N7)-methyltransferase TrmB [Epsilonproteobacteria bacterium]|nr:tRNA (guanosine(46)-N7)-methyltransferase TrmB [Campylobacterota bacterium]